MTRDEARAHWAKSGLTYDDLTDENVKRLRNGIDAHLRESGLIGGTFRAKRVGLTVRFSSGAKWATILCKASYFDDRQAVTFEKGGFIGFAGWADNTNVQPILAAFVAWVDELVSARVAA